MDEFTPRNTNLGAGPHRPQSRSRRSKHEHSNRDGLQAHHQARIGLAAAVSLKLSMEFLRVTRRNSRLSWCLRTR